MALLLSRAAVYLSLVRLQRGLIIGNKPHVEDLARNVSLAHRYIIGRDDVLGTLEFDLCKLKMGHGPKDIEKTIDMNWMGMVKGATLSLTLHNKGGWGEFDG